MRICSLAFAINGCVRRCKMWREMVMDGKWPPTKRRWIRACIRLKWMWIEDLCCARTAWFYIEICGMSFRMPLSISPKHSLANILIYTLKCALCLYNICMIEEYYAHSNIEFVFVCVCVAWKHFLSSKPYWFSIIIYRQKYVILRPCGNASFYFVL